jgi:lycopene beta-cyclase
VPDRRDYLIVGGGLAGGLIALAVRHRQPAATVTVVERDDRPAGNHTWAFHALDVPPAADGFVRPLVVADWAGYRVRFPGYEREVSERYAAVTADRFAAAVERSGCELRTGAEAVAVAADRVELADGTTLRGRCVIDARGPVADPPPGCGFQKFVGLEVQTDRPWPHPLPTVMDATVPQDDGYRFVYALPFGPTRVLVEDTYFSDTPHLDRAKLRSRVGDYLRANGIATWRVVREEAGVLPMPWAGGGVRVELGGPLTVGYAGGWFHPATGYSFPLAVRLALAVAAVPPEQATAAASALARRVAPRQRFGRFLNRLLFTLVTPDQRWQVFRRLYRSLPDAVLSRFYACEFGAIDAGRLLVGWPPPLSPSRLIHRPEVRPCPPLPV